MTRPRVLFVGTDDAGPARMAASCLEQLAGERYEAVSAGVDPAPQPHPEAVEAMAEIGVVLADTPGRPVTAELLASADRVVVIGAVDWEPFDLAVPVEEWGIPGPAGRPLPEVRVLRDTIRRLVDRLVARLDTEAVVR